MRPRRESGVARRRDDGLRQIRSDAEVRYPGVELPPELLPDATPADDAADGRRLAPALDAGVAVQTRVSRQQQIAARRRRTTIVASAAVVIALIASVAVWRYVSDLRAAAAPLAADTALRTSAAASATGGLHATATAVSAVTQSPTPIFATCRGLKLRLPVPLAHLTEVGFHQAAYKFAMRLQTPLKDASIAKAARDKSTHRNLSKQPTGPDAVLIGYCIRMWRSNRSGRPDTAADVGANPGTTVLAPVTGVIVRIRPYLLYGRWPDYEVHIHPDGTSGLDVVLIHLTDLSCTVGEHVDGGLTPIARVRKLSDKFFDQLAEFTRGGGNHVHINVDDSNYPGYTGLNGAISPDDTQTTATTGTAATLRQKAEATATYDSGGGD